LQLKNIVLSPFDDWSFNYEIAKAEYERGVADKDHESLVRAEYYAQLALLYDKGNAEAAEVLSKVRTVNLPTYSAYEAVITDKPDSNIYDQVNKYDILLAIPVVQKAGNVTLKAEMYNYSYNPQRLRPENFSLEDVSGKRYKALGSSKIDKEILDQEHECKMRLVFPRVSGKIRKLVYENGEHLSEKYFF